MSDLMPPAPEAPAGPEAQPRPVATNRTRTAKPPDLQEVKPDVALNGADGGLRSQPERRTLPAGVIAIVLLLTVVLEVAGWKFGWLTSSANQIFTSAALAVIGLLLVAEGLAASAGTSFLFTVILGEDGRTSTSKTFVLMWTLLVGWALLALVVAGELVATRPCTLVANPSCANDGVGFLQLGWQSFVKTGLQTSYLVLLGIPAGAAIVAKAVTEQKAAAKSLAVRAVTTGDKKFSARIAQIFSADDGTTDIGDFQYMLFNLILAAYFIAGLINLSSVGLPAIPDTLLGLTSVSAALYVGKKAASRLQPAVNAVIPSLLVERQGFLVLGTDLTDDPSIASRMSPRVMIDGVEALNVKADPSIPDRISATVPPNLNRTGQDIEGRVEVVSAFGRTTQPFTVHIKAGR